MSGMADDRETKTMLYEGCSISQLGKIFQMDNRTIASKLFLVAPCGQRRGSPIFQIRDAAPYLSKPLGNIEDYIKRMNHADLPPLLTKEFWNGQKARQSFEENEGDLWRTDDVMETLAEVFKLLRQNLMLAKDRVDRESVLSQKQRTVLGQIIDGSLIEIRDSLVKRFENEPKRIRSTEAGPASFAHALDLSEPAEPEVDEGSYNGGDDEEPSWQDPAEGL